MRLLDGKPWVHSTATNIAATLRAHGHVAPEQRAQESEHEARIEGALRCMQVIQAQMAAERKVTRLDSRRAK